MKSFLLFTLLTLALFSCKEATPPQQEVKVEKIQPEIPEEDTFPYDTLQGMYMGDFGGAPIRIIINYASASNAIGYNIHKGLQRNIMGEVVRSGDSIQVILAEPGDNKYDGVFTINFIGIDIKPTGTWVANDESIPSQDFKLEKIIREESDSDEVTMHNFADIFGEVGDKYGTYNFEHDGYVVLKHYKDISDDEDVQWDMQQYTEIKGSWELNGDKVTINWEPNPVYKSGKLVLEVIHFDEYGEYLLRENEDHELWMMWF